LDDNPINTIHHLFLSSNPKATTGYGTSVELSGLGLRLLRFKVRIRLRVKVRMRMGVRVRIRANIKSDPPPSLLPSPYPSLFHTCKRVKCT
jgi:hypothetical protein